MVAAHRALKKELELMKSGASEDSKKADALKNEGNKALKEGDFENAVDCYAQAIELDGTNAIYYCNRAIAYYKLGESLYDNADIATEHFQKTLCDGTKSIDIDQKYSKGYYWKGKALMALQKFQEAKQVFLEATIRDCDNPDIRSLLKEAKKAIQQQRFQQSIRSGSSNTTSVESLDEKTECSSTKKDAFSITVSVRNAVSGEMILEPCQLPSSMGIEYFISKRMPKPAGAALSQVCLSHWELLVAGSTTPIALENDNPLLERSSIVAQNLGLLSGGSTNLQLEAIAKKGLSPCPQLWGSLVGVDADMAVAAIKKAGPALKPHKVLVDICTAITMDLRFDRVRVFHDASNKVTETPKIA